MAQTDLNDVSFDESGSHLRRGIKEFAKIVLDLKKHKVFQTNGPFPADKGEMTANIMLAYRHLEDAAMRLGKAIQAYDGGVSVYDK